jgi:membrane-associated progesterone receptor component
MAMAVYTTVMEEITGYTGLSPAAFFTILALMAVVYTTVCGMFVAPEDFNKPPVVMANNLSSNILNMNNSTAKPLQLGEVTEHQLKAYDGSDPNKPILMAIKGQIYDVSASGTHPPPPPPPASHVSCSLCIPPINSLIIYLLTHDIAGCEMIFILFCSYHTQERLTI